MRQWIYNAIAVVLFFAGINMGFAEPGRIFLDKECTLGLGQSAMTADGKLVIKFKAVLEDSRCPVNVVCVWAGNGKVEFEVIDIDGQKKSVALNTEEEPKAAAFKGHRLTLLSLDPPRRDGVSLLPEDYFVTIRVQKIASNFSQDKSLMAGRSLHSNAGAEES
ncbi:hypothetical protein [Methylomicrobium lacus]|uniref:hypothetical protein n=1 Tax=Methylomicrobium lacus TaxID=136992 RepID=UPI0035A83D83